MARTHRTTNQSKKDPISRGTNFKSKITKSRIRDRRSAVGCSVARHYVSEASAVGRSLRIPNLDGDLVDVIETDPQTGYLVNDIWSVIFKLVIQTHI